MAIRRINGWHVFEGVTPLRLCTVVNQPWIASYLLVNWQKKSYLMFICHLAVTLNRVYDIVHPW